MITVLDPGMLTTLQDRGRVGYAHLGVPRAGAADMLSLRHANRLAGNADDRCAALEYTFVGPTLRFDVDSVLALTGGGLDAQLDGEPVPMYQSVPVRAGQTLVCGRLRSGARGYLAVCGGIRSTPVLGSMATDTLSGLGPQALRRDDTLSIDSTQLREGFYLRNPPTFSTEVSLRVLPGPHQDHFTAETRRELYTTCFTADQQSDRTGVRLETALVLAQALPELPSQGMTTGAVQVPGDGRPLLLLANHGTTGGYPVIANVISADHWRLGQLGTGARVRFAQVEHAQALLALHEQERALQDEIVDADAALLSARALLLLAHSNPEMRELRLQQGARRVRLRR